MKTKPVPTEGQDSAKLETESALCGASCCASSVFGVGSTRWFKRLSWEGSGSMFQIEVAESELDALISELSDESQELVQEWGNEDREDMVVALILLRGMNAQEAKEVLTCYESGRCLPGTLRRNRRSQKNLDADRNRTSPCTPTTSSPDPARHRSGSNTRPENKDTTSGISGSPETA